MQQGCKAYLLPSQSSLLEILRKNPFHFTASIILTTLNYYSLSHFFYYILLYLFSAGVCCNSGLLIL
jgi:hypothetical protein